MTSCPAVPFVDLAPSHLPLKDAVMADIAGLIDTGAFINGPQVGRFEAAFAAWCRSPNCVGVASGLDALRLGLLATGVGPGDEVIMPAQTFVATAEAITQTGAQPVLVDVGDDGNIDPAAAEAAISSRTRAVLAVHLFGQLADMRALTELAARHDIDVHEDAAQAHGAERGGIRAGQAGRTAGFSFYPGKNLGAFGDAGALVTHDEAVAVQARALREHGQHRKYEHDAVGYTARLDTLQAIVLEHKLAHLDAWNEHRRAAAAYYSAALEGVGDLRLPPVAADSRPVWHLYALRTRDPDALSAALKDRNVASGRHYPVPVHLTGAYVDLGHQRGSFPIAEDWAARELSLPLYPGITEAQLDAVVSAVRAYFDG